MYCVGGCACHSAQLEVSGQLSGVSSVSTMCVLVIGLRLWGPSFLVWGTAPPPLPSPAPACTLAPILYQASSLTPLQVSAGHLYLHVLQDLKFQGYKLNMAVLSCEGPATKAGDLGSSSTTSLNWPHPNTNGEILCLAIHPSLLSTPFSVLTRLSLYVNAQIPSPSLCLPHPSFQSPGRVTLEENVLEESATFSCRRARMKLKVPGSELLLY